MIEIATSSILRQDNFCESQKSHPYVHMNSREAGGDGGTERAISDVVSHPAVLRRKGYCSRGAPTLAQTIIKTLVGQNGDAMLDYDDASHSNLAIHPQGS